MFVVKGVMVSHKSFRANGSEHDKMFDKFSKLTLVGTCTQILFMRLISKRVMKLETWLLVNFGGNQNRGTILITKYRIFYITF